MLKELRRLFLLGVFTAAPLALTVYLFWKLFAWFDELFQPIVSPISAPFFSGHLPGLGTVVGILFILLVGLIAPSLIGKQILFMTERIMQRVPLAKLVYSGSKQIFDSFSADSLQKFNRVVMIEFPGGKSQALGFVTQEVDATWLSPKGQKRLGVFIPTTPNPTSGYLVFVPEEQTVPLQMSVEDALKLILSGGIVKMPLV